MFWKKVTNTFGFEAISTIFYSNFSQLYMFTLLTNYHKNVSSYHNEKNKHAVI